MSDKRVTRAAEPHQYPHVCQKRTVLTLAGHVPAKKNRWHRSSAGAVYFDQKGIQAQIDALVLQAQSQWRGRAPADKPAIMVTFHVRDGRGDLDNKYTTLQDALVTAGVLKSDNVKHLPGPIGFRGLVDKDERTVVELMEAA